MGQTYRLPEHLIFKFAYTLDENSIPQKIYYRDEYSVHYENFQCMIKFVDTISHSDNIILTIKVYLKHLIQNFEVPVLYHYHREIYEKSIGDISKLDKFWGGVPKEEALSEIHNNFFKNIIRIQLSIKILELIYKNLV